MSVIPSSARTSSARKRLPVHSRLGRVTIACAASATSSGLRERAIASSPPSRFCTAAVAMMVRGHRALKAMPSSRNSSAIPIVHMLIPYFARV